MKRTTPLMALSIALALWACSKVETEPSGSSTDASQVKVIQGNASVSDDIKQAHSLGGIPKNAQGRWGLTDKDCTATPGEADGFLTVSAHELTFYEAVATLENLTQHEPYRIRGMFRFSGEGQSWTQDLALEVQRDGNTMTRHDYGPDALPVSQKYTRCL